MTRRTHRVLLGAAVVLLAATSLLALRTARQAFRYLHPTRVRVTPDDRARAAKGLPGLEDVELRTRDGMRLAGWFAPGSARSAVALVHGLSGNRAQLLPEAEVLARHGHGVLLFDSRASGDSDGEVATWGDRERLDVVAALDFLSARTEVDPARIGVYGFSVGATSAALVAAADARVHALALGPVWPSLREELADKFPAARGRSAALAAWIFRRAGTSVEALRPSDAVATIAPRPLLLLSGSQDDDTPPAVMDRLLARAPGAERWLVQGAGHGAYGGVDPVGLDEHLGGFFDRALIPGAPGPDGRSPQPASVGK